MPITFPYPWAQWEIVDFLFQRKAHIFLIANLKLRFQTPYSFGDMTENEKISGTPIKKNSRGIYLSESVNLPIFPYS